MKKLHDAIKDKNNESALRSAINGLDLDSINSAVKSKLGVIAGGDLGGGS